MTVSPTVSPAVELRAHRLEIASKLAHAAISLVAFALLAGIWLAYFMVLPPDFTVR